MRYVYRGDRPDFDCAAVLFVTSTIESNEARQTGHLKDLIADILETARGEHRDPSTAARVVEKGPAHGGGQA